METVTGYVFHPGHLKPQERKPGISAFMRIRNGEDFLEAAIRSHIDCFDEIVAVHNQSTDGTVDILQRLASEYGPKIKVYHYTDRVYPPGSPEHAREPADSPNSLVNYYNFALARTTRAIVTKLDDDHLAMDARMLALANRVRADIPVLTNSMACFSGVNLARTESGDLGVPASDLLCGNGDHWFFRVSEDTWFERDRRFEKLRHHGLKRRFYGFAYWHLKYLKPGAGFANYELDKNPGSRYIRRLERIGKSAIVDLPAARQLVRPGVKGWLKGWTGDKGRLLYQRAAAFDAAFPQANVEDALDATSPEWRSYLPLKK
ncbi:glycosyltransferase [Aliihoeflea sp. PC F10.4]